MIGICFPLLTMMRWGGFSWLFKMHGKEAMPCIVSGCWPTIEVKLVAPNECFWPAFPFSLLILLPASLRFLPLNECSEAGMCFGDLYFIGRRERRAKRSPSPTFCFSLPPSTFLLDSILLTCCSRKSNQAGSVRADCWGWEVSCGWLGKNSTRLKMFRMEKGVYSRCV